MEGADDSFCGAGLLIGEAGALIGEAGALIGEAGPPVSGRIGTADMPSIVLAAAFFAGMGGSVGAGAAWGAPSLR